MKNLFKLRKGIAVAVSCFAFCISNNLYGQCNPATQPCWQGGGTACFTLTVTTTTTCGKYCGPGPTDNACDHCVTFTIHNASTGCDIQQLTVESLGSGGTHPCYSVCAPAIWGTPDDVNCEVNTNGVSGNYKKTFTGHFRAGDPDRSFSICYNAGTTPQPFKIYISNDNGDASCCDIGSNSNNYYLYSF